MKEYSRTERVADQIQRELGTFIQREVKDPRLAFCTITGVKVSSDLQVATVYVSFLNGDDDKTISEGLTGLSRAAGFLRMHLGKVMRLRKVPELRFKHDTSILYGQKMNRLIDEALQQDKQLHADDSESDETND
jgi:ribosome-binding factor A